MRATVATHLYRAFAAMVTVIVAIGAVATLAAYIQFRAVDELTERVMPERLVNSQVRIAMGDAQRGIRGYLLTGDPAFERVYADARDSYTAAAATLRRLAPGGDRATVARQLDHAATWLRLADAERTGRPDADR